MSRRPLSIFIVLALAVGCERAEPSRAPSPSHSPSGSPSGGADAGAAMVQLPASLGGGSAMGALAPSTPPATMHEYGALMDAPDAAPTTPTPPMTSLPAAADVSADAPPPGNQGHTSSCEAWAAGYSAMGWWANHSGVSGARFAPMYVYSQIVGGNCHTGTTAGKVLTIMQSQGIDTQTDYEPMQFDLDCAKTPTAAQTANAGRFKITGFDRPDRSQGAQAAIESVIAAGHPAILGIVIYREFENASATAYVVGPPASGEAALGQHAVAAFSYDDKGVWILNSWGDGWGKSGWAQLSWSYVNGSVGGKANVYDVAEITGAAITCADANAQCGVSAFDGQCQSSASTLADCCASCANPAPQLSSASQWYRIQSVALGSAYSIDNGVIAASGNYSGQYWKLTPLSSGRFRLTNWYEGDAKALDTTNSSDGPNQTKMAASGNVSGQHWTLTPITDGVYRLTNNYLGAGKSLQAPSGDGAIGFGATANVSSQYWQISLID
jgi:hypothetical protein